MIPETELAPLLCYLELGDDVVVSQIRYGEEQLWAVGRQNPADKCEFTGKE